MTAAAALLDRFRGSMNDSLNSVGDMDIGQCARLSTITI